MLHPKAIAVDEKFRFLNSYHFTVKQYRVNLMFRTAGNNRRLQQSCQFDSLTKQNWHVLRWILHDRHFLTHCKCHEPKKCVTRLGSGSASFQTRYQQDSRGFWSFSQIMKWGKKMKKRGKKDHHTWFRLVSIFFFLLNSPLFRLRTCCTARMHPLTLSYAVLHSMCGKGQPAAPSLRLTQTLAGILWVFQICQKKTFDLNIVDEGDSQFFKDCLRTSIWSFYFWHVLPSDPLMPWWSWLLLRHLVKPGILAIKGAVGKTFGPWPWSTSAPIQKTSCHPGVFQTVFCGWEFTSSTGRSLRMAKPS